jgi:hypothetical protein
VRWPVAMRKLIPVLELVRGVYEPRWENLQVFGEFTQAHCQRE